MRGTLICLTAVFLAATLGSLAMAQEEDAAPVCIAIQDGTLINSAGETLETGFDLWGYNYQARMFNGGYCDAYRNAGWCQPYVDDELIMKWNDAWLSNKDCDGDGLLDRHFGYDGYIGSGAWLTNHQSGVYYPFENKPNKACRWTYFVKIVAAPADAFIQDGFWFDGSGDEIGEIIWGAFATTQIVYNDPCEGFGGLLYKGIRPGLGNWESDPNTDP